MSSATSATRSAAHVRGLTRAGNVLEGEPFDNRRTPLRWLERTAGEAPEKTVEDLRRLTTEETTALRLRVAEGAGEAVVGPYGPVDWSVLTAHVFWDAWLHDRDVTEPLGRSAASESRRNR